MSGKYGRLIFFFFVGLAGLSPVKADIVFPARLELVESEPDLYDFQFNLPVQNGARLKAKPILPSVCEPMAPPQVTFTRFAYTSKGQVKCDSEALPGETIGIQGLLGSRTDVLLSIKTLNGRQYKGVLKPARSMYVIPNAVAWFPLIGKTLLSGMRSTFQRFDLFLLMWLLVLAGLRWRKIILALVAGGVAYAGAQAFGNQYWLLLPASLPAIVVLIFGVLFTLRLTKGGQVDQESRFPLWAAGLILGTLYGGALPRWQATAELSRFEGSMAFFGHKVGFTIGLLILYLLWFEFHQILLHVLKFNKDNKPIRILGKWTCVGAVGLLVYQLSAFSLFPTLVPTAPLPFLILAVLLGIEVGRLPSDQRWLSASAGIFLVLGLIAGAQNFRVPYDSIFIPLILFALGFCLVIKRALPRKLLTVIIPFAVFVSSAQTGFLIQNDLSKPVAHLIGNGFLAAFVFLLTSLYSSQRKMGYPKRIRLAGAISAGLAVVVWAEGLARWFNTTFLSDYAMGFVHIPLVSLVMVMLAIIFWPRRSRVAAHLKLDVRKPIAHFSLLLLAVFLLNVGSLPVKNPLYEPDAPHPDRARIILQTLLSKTYHAFNLDDEEELYKQLSENVGEELVEDLYLDSRRRLTSGVRQGAEVTVKDVSVLRVKDSELQGMDGSDQFAYDVEWVVTARVQHLQHVHHRRNMYVGVLTVRVEDGAWKVQQVDLRSEEREVIPGGTV